MKANIIAAPPLFCSSAPSPTHLLVRSVAPTPYPHSRLPSYAPSYTPPPLLPAPAQADHRADSEDDDDDEDGVAGARRKRRRGSACASVEDAVRRIGEAVARPPQYAA